MARKTLIFLLFIYFSIISCSSNKKNHENNIFEVIIENKRSEAVYIQKLAGYSLHYGENEKIYTLVHPPKEDNLAHDCYNSWYIYDVQLKPNTKTKLTVKIIFNFSDANNAEYNEKLTEKLIFLDTEQYPPYETIEDNPYDENDIKFIIYYTEKPFAVQFFDNYCEMIKNNGHILFGYLKNGIIHFEIR